MQKGIYIDKSKTENGQVEYSFHGLTKFDLDRYKLSFDSRVKVIELQKMRIVQLYEVENETILRNAYQFALQNIHDELILLNNMIKRIEEVLSIGEVIMT